MVSFEVFESLLALLTCHDRSASVSSYSKAAGPHIKGLRYTAVQ
jgi:hypothetical protein